MGKILRNQSPLKLFLFGMLNGLLPCGMVYTALITSVIAGTPILSAFYLFFFGLGTLPGMILITFLANKITTRFRGKINKVLPYFVTIIGALIILRGLNLNIPYLSPKTTIDKKTLEMKVIPCHSNSENLNILF
jgi:sulfite exporter TauE/SafE